MLLSTIVYAAVVRVAAAGAGAAPASSVWLAIAGLAFCGLIILTCDYPTLRMCGVAIVVALPFYLLRGLWVRAAPTSAPPQ